MTASRRVAALPLMLIGLAALCASVALIPGVVNAQSQEVTATAAATGVSPPAKPTALEASAEHDSVTLTWTASTDQTVTHYAILRRNPDTDALGVFHVVESNAGGETSYDDSSVAASSTYIYRVKSVSPTGVSQWSGYVKVDTPAAPDPPLTPSTTSTPALTPTTTSTPTPSTTSTPALTPTTTSTPAPEPVSTPAPEDLRPTGLTVSLVENRVTLSWTAPAEDAESVDGYEILRRRPSMGETTLATLVADTESTATAYSDATANEAGVRYVYRVKALRGDEVSLWSNYDRIDLPADYVPDPTPAPEPEAASDDEAPTGLSAALADGGGVTLAWSAPAEDAESVTGYEVLRAVGEGEFTTLVADTASTGTTYIDATATVAGETYAYEVKAVRGEDRSQPSGQAQVQLPHDPVDLAPTGLTAAILTAIVAGEEDTTSVHLSWIAPAGDAESVTGYEVLRAVGQGEFTTLVDDTGSTATSYLDATATVAGETYAYQVKVIRGEDRSQASGQAQVQIPHDPVDPVDLAPSNLTAEAVDGGVNLSWTAPAEDAESVTGYEILRAAGEGELTTLAADTASTATAYTDATATEEGETYAYQVKAVRGEDRSQGSNRVALIAVEPPATPENLAPTNLTFEIRDDGVALSWDAPATDADSVTGYRVLRRRPNQGGNEWLVWKWDTGSAETTYRDGYARTHGEFYMYRVRALRGDDYSKMSNRVDVRRPEATPQTTAWAPSNLVAQMYFEVALGEEGVTTQVKLAWDAPAEGTEWVRGYEVQRATCNGEFAALAADTGSTATAYTDADAEAGESYTYRVRARRPQGLSLTSNTWTILLPGGNGEGDCEPALQEGALEFVPEVYQLSMHDTPLVKNTGQTSRTSIGDELTSTTFKRAQAFTTGAEANGYTLSSIGISFFDIDQTSTAGSHLVATLNAVASNGNPGASLCTLADPSSFTGSGVQTFGAPVGCPTLAASTRYFVVIERVQDNGQAIKLSLTSSNSEDTGGAAGWSIGNGRYDLESGQPWNTTGSDPYQIEVRGVVRSTFDPSTQEFNTLGADGVTNALGLWSDGTTMWVSHNPEQHLGDTSSPKLFAYNMATKARDSAKDFNTLDAAGNDSPRGIWSDGSTMWVVDVTDEKIYAYDMDTKARVSSKDFNNLHRIREDVDEQDARPFGIWSDGEIMWVVDANDFVIYAYDMDTKKRVPGEDFGGLEAASNIQTSGLWADETTMFVANAFNPNRIYAYWRSNKAPNPDRYITLEAGNDRARGIWSDGSTMWVSDRADDKLYAYALPDAGPPPDTLSVEHVTDTMALVKVDIGELVRAYGSSEPAVSVSVLGTLSSASMYVHPEGGYARFLLLGLRPETQYTVIASYGITTRYDLGDAGREVFRTDYARLAGMETSGLTHTEATVTVTLNAAGLDRGCCFKFYPHSNKDEAERDYTFYLRHKPSDDTVWSEPVELDFSDFAAAARLTGLDPGTDYDVEVAETADFMPPQGSAGSYTGTLTVATDEASGIGFDQVGYGGGVVDPYGSLSPTTFALGGVDHSIIELRVAIPSFFFPSTEFGKLFLTFDKALPDGIEFTLTVGTTEFNSSDANLYEQTYDWAGGPTWAVSDSVTVELDFTGTVPFREGTTLERAFTTPPLPTPFTFEAEMTVGTDVNTAGYDSTQGTLSQNTFEVGGVEYTVNRVLYQSLGSLTGFQLEVQPAIPFAFNLTLDGGTPLKSDSATTPAVIGGGTLYRWAGTTNPNWASGNTVDVELEVFETIDICDRSPVVAHAIREATPSFDFCQMTSPIDLANLTELRIPNGRGTGLKAGDFEGLSGLTRLDLSHYILSLQQLPVDVFDGLDSLTHLDISHTGLLNLDLGVFEGLDNLVELDLSDTHLQRRTVPVGVFSALSNLEVLRLTNESPIGGYRRSFSNLDVEFFTGLDKLRELDVGSSTPLRDSPLSLKPLTSLETYNGRPYTRPADPPANFQYASGQIDHERGYFKTCYTVTLRWDPPTGVSGITGYRILRNLGAESLSRYAKQIATTGASARTFIDGRDADICFGGVGSSPNVSYFVSAIIGNKDSFPARVRVDQTQAFPTTQVPSTPTLSGSLYDLSVARSPNGYKVRLRWNSTHHNITGYEISFRGSSSDAWQTIVENAGNVLEYDLESVPVPPSSVPRTAENMFLYNAFRDQGESIGFTDGREFRIRALNAAGAGPWSNVVRPFR